MMKNPEMIRQMVDNPLVQQLMANPAVMKEMMMSAPQSRELLEVQSFVIVLGICTVAAAQSDQSRVDKKA